MRSVAVIALLLCAASFYALGTNTHKPRQMRSGKDVCLLSREDILAMDTRTALDILLQLHGDVCAMGYDSPEESCYGDSLDTEDVKSRNLSFHDSTPENRKRNKNRKQDGNEAGNHDGVYAVSNATTVRRDATHFADRSMHEDKIGRNRQDADSTTMSDAGLFPFNIGGDQKFISGYEDGCFLVFEDDTVQFFNKTYTTLSVCIDGFISLDGNLPDMFSYVFPIPEIAIIAPFWANIDITKNVGGESGRIYYERIPVDSEYCAEYNQVIRDNFEGNTLFEASRIYLFTWFQVGACCDTPYPYNTFQAAIVSDETSYFTILRYPEDGISWISSISNYYYVSYPIMGVNGGDGYNHVSLPFSGSIHATQAPDVSNTNRKGVWAYKIDTAAAPLSPGVDQLGELMKIYDSTDGLNWWSNDGWGTDTPLCEWFGVYCMDGCTETTIQTNECPVSALILAANSLVGSLPDIRLPFLTTLDLSGNDMIGTIPNLNLPCIVNLMLSFNNFYGDVPILSTPNLQVFYIQWNLLNGTIPELDTPLLGSFNMEVNYLHGSLPSLDMSYLRKYRANDNKLDGTISNFTAPLLEELFLYQNRLDGTLPYLDTPYLRQLRLSANNLSGPVPDFSRFGPFLFAIFMTSNRFTGTMPMLDQPYLSHLWMDNNMLEGSIPSFNTPILQYLSFCNNNLNGNISYFDTPLLAYFLLSNNFISGTIPEFYMPNVLEMKLDDNNLEGTIYPFELPSLISMDLSNNRLSGTIPAFRLDNLVSMVLSFNQLSGSIPDFYLPKVQQLYLNNNNLEGSVEDSNLYQLKDLDLSNNQLDGTLSDLRNVMGVLVMNFNNNKLTGKIPGLLLCPCLLILSLANNQFTSLSGIPASVRTYDASNNHLTGQLPEIQSSNLKELDLSMNNLTGTVPKWMFLPKLEKLDLFGNEHLSGPLPLGMDSYHELKLLSVSSKTLQVDESSTTLLPRVLSFSSTFQIRNPEDKYQCPLIINPSKTHSQITIPSSYYQHRACKCLPNYYGRGNKCVLCPSYCECSDGLTLKNCYAPPGLSSTKGLLLCPRVQSCMGASFNYITNQTIMSRNDVSCTQGYESRVCSKCSTGYGSQNRICTKCDDVSSIVSIVVASAGFGALVIFLYVTAFTSAGEIRILIFHIQTVSTIASIVTNSDKTSAFIDLSFSTSSIQLPILSCILGTNDEFTLLLFSYLRIPLLLFVSSVIYLLSSSETRHKVVYIALNLLFFIYFSISHEVFGVFGCTLDDEGDGNRYLNIFPWIQCQPASEVYLNMIALSVPVFVVFIIGFPAYVWMKCQNTNVLTDETLRHRYSYLILPYKEEYKFWEFIIFSRRVLISLFISVVPYSNPTLIYFLVMFVIQVSIFVQKQFSPCKSDMANQMELSSLYVILISFFLTLLTNFVGSHSWVISLLIGINSVWLLVFMTCAYVIPLLYSLQRARDQPFTYFTKVDNTSDALGTLSRLDTLSQYLSSNELAIN